MFLILLIRAKVDLGVDKSVEYVLGGDVDINLERPKSKAELMDLETSRELL